MGFSLQVSLLMEESVRSRCRQDYAGVPADTDSMGSPADSDPFGGAMSGPCYFAVVAPLLVVLSEMTSSDPSQSGRAPASVLMIFSISTQMASLTVSTLVMSDRDESLS